MAYHMPYLRYSRPNNSPKIPFSKKHLASNIGVSAPKAAAVAGRCPAANSRAEMILADIKILSGSLFFDVFLKKSFHSMNDIRDMRNNLIRIFSTIPP